ncbi:MAG: DegV family protein, partial [Anaerolineales bacterium]|nr:DegV family protein [Anaerolineales bacterium]
DEIAVEYANRPDDARELIESLQYSFPGKQIYVSRASPVIGTHTGPGLIAVSVRRNK